MDVFLPSDLEEALTIKSSRPECLPIAGGTDVMVGMNFGWFEPPALLDLSRVPELAEWRVDGSRLILGSGVTYSQIISELPLFPPLAAASRTIGSPQIRNRATVGGNLGTSSPAGDALPVLAVFDAQVSIASAGKEERFIPWEEFLLGPGRNSLEPDELVSGVSWRLVRGPGSFSKVGTRNAMVIAVASLCLLLDEDEQKARVAVGSVAPTVIRVSEAEGVLNAVLESAGIWGDARASIDETGLEDAVRALQRSVSPIDDHRGTAAYRKHACGVLLRRAIAWALQERIKTENKSC